MECEVVGQVVYNPTRLRTFIADICTHPPGMTLPRTVWVRLNYLRTGVGRFRSCLHKLGMASSADICSTQGQLVHQVGMHGISNRDSHFYLLYNNSSVHLTTLAEISTL